MSSASKILLIVVALFAFAIGWVVKSPSVDGQIDAQSLLRARLLNAQAEPIEVAEVVEGLTVVNFWATWCAPCREEMPMFEMFYRLHENQDFTILGVAIDSPETARPMLDSMDITYPILYAEKSGMDLMARVGNAQGFLPYTILLNDEGEVLEVKIGRVHEADLQQWWSDYAVKK